MKLVKKIKINPNSNQKNIIDFWFRRCKILYNVALEEKLYYYKATGGYLDGYKQKKELVELKNEINSWKDVPNKSLQEIIMRLDNTYKQFFKGKGFPKFKSEISSIFFAKTDVRLKNNDLYLPKIKTNLSYEEQVPENYSSVRLVKEENLYFLVFNYEKNITKKDFNKDILGVDLGLESLYTDSNGKKVKRFSRKLIKKYNNRISDLNKSLSTKKKGSKRRNKVKKQLNKTYNKLKNSKKDYLHKASKNLISCKEDNIIIGDIKVQNIVNKNKSKKGLIKSFYNSSLTTFKEYIKYKGELYNKNVIFINESYTSKTCSGCHRLKEMKLNDRVYECEYCNNSIDRDENSAINMKLLGSSSMNIYVYACSLE